MTDKVTVTVADDHLDRIQAVADSLRQAGMRVEHVLSAVGVITGSISRDRRRTVGRLPGVLTIEDDATVRLSPPESPIQ